MLAVTLFSCSKNTSEPKQPTEPQTPGRTNQSVRHSIKFNLSSFQIDYLRKNTGAKEVNAKDYFKYLVYSVYDSSGRLVNKVEQKAGGNNFGQIADSLSKGSYTVVLGGSPDSIFLQNDPYWFTRGTDTSLSTLKYYTIYFAKDFFHKKFALTVNNNDTTVSNIKLDRIMGSLEIKLKDSIPFNAIVAGTLVYGHSSYFNVANETVISGDSSWATQFSRATSTMNGYYFGSNEKMRVVIQVYTPERYIEKTIDNVVVYPNRKTILTGYVLTPDADTSGNVSVGLNLDPDYTETIVQEF